MGFAALYQSYNRAFDEFAAAIVRQITYGSMR
jgi:hypothetical protein